MSTFDYLERHKLITLLIVIWMLGIVTWVTFRVFGLEPPDISSTTVTALGIVFGLPTLAVGLLKWRGEIISMRKKDDDTIQK